MKSENFVNRSGEEVAREKTEIEREGAIDGDGIAIVEKIGATNARLDGIDVSTLSPAEREVVEKCKKKSSTILRAFGRIASALTFVGFVGGIAIDQLVNRNDIEVREMQEKNTYRHSDPETTHLINYLAGKENLSEDELMQALRTIMRGVLEKFDHMNLPEDFDHYSAEQLDDFFSQHQEFGMPKGELIKFVREQAHRECPRNAEIYNELWQLEKESGAPQVRINTSFAAFAQSKEGGPRAHYSSLTHTIYLNTPFVGCELDEFFGEMAHAEQFTPNSTARYSNMGRGVWDLLRVAMRARLNPAHLVEEYNKTYQQPGTIEYEAHGVIAPRLRDKYKKLATADQPQDINKDKPEDIEKNKPEDVQDTE